MIEVEQLVKTFGKGDDAVKAVTGIDFSVPEGEIFGLLGANGAGKSTVVLMLATLLEPTSGNARVAGHDVVADPTKARLSFGAALQETGLDPLQKVSGLAGERKPDSRDFDESLARESLLEKSCEGAPENQARGQGKPKAKSESEV
jgi:ABC-type oligopeptide transport system ATPase subunit